MPSTMRSLSEDYGYQLAFLKSDKELWKVFNKAVDGGWDATRFTAAVRKTKWYKTTDANQRKQQQLKYTDPASYKQSMTDAKIRVRQIGRQIGAVDSAIEKRLDTLATWVVDHGWDETRLRDFMTRYVNVSRSDGGRGEAGSVEDALRRTAFRNGVRISDAWINNQAKAVIKGRMTIEDAQQELRERYAKSVAPGFAKELAAGQDLYDIASPYMQTMAKTLELNPSDIDLFDPTIRRALASSTSKDGEPGSTPLWEFERSLRKDSRWLKTNGARGEIDKTVRGLSQAFGLGV